MAQSPDQHINTIISISSAVIAIIMADVQMFISSVAAFVAILSGCMAIRYYYYSTKKLNKKE